MSKLTKTATCLALASLTAFCLAACGSSQPKTIPSNAVALIDHTPLSKATLNHWMNSIVGGDFYEHFGRRAPRGLVSEPANYPACMNAATTLTVASGRSFTSNQLADKCRQLYQAIKEQTLSFLIPAQWRIDEAAEVGVKVSDADVASISRQDVAQRYPKAGEFDTFLANHEWAPSDELYQLKRNLLTTKLREKVSHRSSNEHETLQSHAAFVHFVLQHTKKQTASTLCRPAYSVPTCRGYKTTTASSTTSPLLILEELAGS
jgi:hypothetical protein